MLHVLKKLDDWMACAAVTGIVLVTIAAVIMRYVLNQPLQWVEELTIALFIWAIMIGAASAMKERMHISIDAFTSLLSPRVQRLIRIANDLVSVAVLVVFGILGLELTLNAGSKIMPILGLKYAWIDLAVPVGAFWMAAHILLHIRTEPKSLLTEDAPSEDREAQP